MKTKKIKKKTSTATTTTIYERKKKNHEFSCSFSRKKIEMQFLIQANNIVLLKENSREKKKYGKKSIHTNAFSIIGS